MMKLYNIVADEENLKKFNENGLKYESVDELNNGLDSFEDKLNNILSEKIDSLLSSHGLSTDLEEYLPSDKIFYKKITSYLLPDEKDEELASQKVLETFLMVKADRYYQPSKEQLTIMKNTLDYEDGGENFFSMMIK